MTLQLIIPVELAKMHEIVQFLRNFFQNFLGQWGVVPSNPILWVPILGLRHLHRQDLQTLIS